MWPAAHSAGGQWGPPRALRGPSRGVLSPRGPRGPSWQFLRGAPLIELYDIAGLAGLAGLVDLAGRLPCRPAGALRCKINPFILQRVRRAPCMAPARPGGSGRPAPPRTPSVLIKYHCQVFERAALLTRMSQDAAPLLRPPFPAPRDAHDFQVLPGPVTALRGVARGRLIFPSCDRAGQ